MPARRPAASSASQKPLTLQRVANRLHKNVCQSLTGARFLLSVIERRAARENPELPAQLQEVNAVLESSCVELRALIKELRTAGKNKTR